MSDEIIRFVVLPVGGMSRYSHITLYKTYRNARVAADGSEVIKKLNPGANIQENAVFLFDPSRLLQVHHDTMTNVEMDRMSPAEFADRQTMLWAARAARLIAEDKPYKPAQAASTRVTTKRRKRCKGKCKRLRFPEELDAEQRCMTCARDVAMPGYTAGLQGG